MPLQSKRFLAVNTYTYIERRKKKPHQYDSASEKIRIKMRCNIKSDEGFPK